MKIDLDKLKVQVADPEWPERLLPLFLFKGSKPARLHALWNIAYGMYLSECESFGDAIKTFNTPKDYLNKKSGKTHIHWSGHPTETAHLCGLHAPLQITSLRSIFERMKSCPQLTDSVDPAFTEYVEWVYPGSCLLEPVPQVSNYTRVENLAWWRTPRPQMKRGRKADPNKAPSVKRAAWYMKSAPTISQRPNVSADIALMQHIHRIVPAWLPHDLKGDLCQDLLVAVLSGETSVANLPDMMNRYASAARKLMPDRWKHVSWEGMASSTEDGQLSRIIGGDHAHF